jgi:O-acetylserine/cysteine efflux transporter
MAPRDIVLLVGVAMLWGFNFVPIRWALDAVPPFALAATRFTFAALPMVFFVRRPQAPVRLLVAYGLLIGVGQFGLLFLAISLGMSAGLASLLAQLQVFFTIALAALIAGDRATREQLIGAFVAGLGIALLVYERVVGGASSSLLTLLLVVVSAAFWGVANVIARHLGRTHHVDGFNLVVWSSLASPLPLALMSYVLEGGTAPLSDLLHAGLLAWASIAFIVIGATLWGFATWNRLLRRYTAAAVTPFALLVPIAGLGSAALILGEQLTLIEIAAGLIILLGLAIALVPRSGGRGLSRPTGTPGD